MNDDRLKRVERMCRVVTRLAAVRGKDGGSFLRKGEEEDMINWASIECAAHERVQHTATQLVRSVMKNRDPKELSREVMGFMANALVQYSLANHIAEDDVLRAVSVFLTSEHTKSLGTADDEEHRDLDALIALEVA